jgi:methionyl-tRNA formyltransferase
MKGLKSQPRVIILTVDGFYSRLFIEHFLATSSVQLVGVIESTSYLKRNTQRFKDLWAFLQKVGIAYGLYQAFVCWVLPYLKGIPKVNGNLIFFTNDINSSEMISLIKRLEPDFLLAMHFNQKILQSVIESPTQATLNFHPSLLPQWRGVDPILFALQNKNSEISPPMGVSIHLITNEIDAGDILYQSHLENIASSGLITINSQLFIQGGIRAAHVISHFDTFYASRVTQSSLGTGCYYGWAAVGKLGWSGLRKALWAKSPNRF